MKQFKCFRRVGGNHDLVTAPFQHALPNPHHRFFIVHQQHTPFALRYVAVLIGRGQRGVGDFRQVEMSNAVQMANKSSERLKQRFRSFSDVQEASDVFAQVGQESVACRFCRAASKAATRRRNSSSSTISSACVFYDPRSLSVSASMPYARQVEQAMRPDSTLPNFRHTTYLWRIGNIVPPNGSALATLFGRGTRVVGLYEEGIAHRKVFNN